MTRPTVRYLRAHVQVPTRTTRTHDHWTVAAVHHSPAAGWWCDTCESGHCEHIQAVKDTITEEQP